MQQVQGSVIEQMIEGKLASQELPGHTFCYSMLMAASEHFSTCECSFKRNKLLYFKIIDSVILQFIEHKHYQYVLHYYHRVYLDSSAAHNIIELVD